MSIGVLGAGAFGTALAVSLADNGPVTLWARDSDHASALEKERVNAKRLPGIVLPDAVSATAQMSTVLQHETLLLAVPMQKMRGVLAANADDLKDRALVACCKGVELTTGLGPVGVIGEVAPRGRAAVLTGPSFAKDIARGLPTALTLACADSELLVSLQERLTTRNIRVYRTTDTVGAELGGALKNVMAIACGAVMGAGLGESARAALMTRGYAEMQRMALSLGSRPETLAGLSGFGDLALTCTSDQSRNFRLGHSIGKEVPFDASITVEGAATARAVSAKAKDLAIEMPITDCVVALLDRSVTLGEAMAQLLSRPLKEE